MPYDNSAALMPEIVEWSPHIGTEGTQFTVYLQSSVDLKTGDRHFRLSFGSFRCNSTGLTKSEDRPGTYYVTCDVPPSTQTGWPSPQVTVYLHIEDKHGDELNTIPVGEFTYSDAVPQTTYSTPNSSRKRKLSNDPEENIRGPIKRTASQPAIRPKGEDYGNMYPYQAQSGVGGTPYTSYAPTTINDRSYIYSAYDQTDQQNQSQFPPHASPRTYPYGSYPATSVAAHSAVVAQQHLQSWPHSYPSASASASAPPVISPPSASSKPSSGPHTLPSPDGPNPPLVRTSTLQQGQTSSAGNTGGSSSANTGPGFNPYGIYPSSAKAVLNIEGDLDSVATIPWNPEEMENRRKLVQFWRHQKGSQITSRFSVIAQNERQPNSICISCIYWAEKGECYVTSVDCIYLLESLVAVRFTVEEKNRIRRNLEGFRPLTVSKAKADSENFFKLIMAFPNPKPRNIEKDVKVFPWKILASALKKIIGKYVSNLRLHQYTYPADRLSLVCQLLFDCSPDPTNSKLRLSWE